jgi:hypothetical protein
VFDLLLDVIRTMGAVTSGKLPRDYPFMVWVVAGSPSIASRALS